MFIIKLIFFIYAFHGVTPLFFISALIASIISDTRVEAMTDSIELSVWLNLFYPHVVYIPKIQTKRYA